MADGRVVGEPLSGQSVGVRSCPAAQRTGCGVWTLSHRDSRSAAPSSASRARCTASPSGRSVSIHPDEALLAELRQRQHTPTGRAKLRERVHVEHALAHIGHWQSRRARYLGTRKNLFDLRCAAVVHNLHVIARQPTTGNYQLAA